jgi:hypothetical protein
MSHLRSSEHYVTKTISFGTVKVSFLFHLPDSPLKLPRLLLQLLDIGVCFLLLFLSALTKSRRGSCVARALLVS